METKRILISVGCIISMTVVYLFANKPSTSSSSTSSSVNRRDLNMMDGIDWKNVNLLALELPNNLEDVVKDVEITQSRHDIYGADTFVQV